MNYEIGYVEKGIKQISDFYRFLVTASFMKLKVHITIIITLIFSILISSLSFAEYNSIPDKELRGVWVASVVNIDYPSKPTTDSEVLKAEAIAILNKASGMGLNAVFLQVRPTSDALYKSDIFPWSKYLTGSQGIAPDNGFDPLAFWIKEGHARGIEIHAWLNPYRITKKTSKEKAYSVTDLVSTHPARLHPEIVVSHTDGNLYFNPGIPEVRNLIVSSITEIVSNYDVDGIHFDDYFYPGTNFNDKDAYAKYGGRFSTVDDFRRDSVNQLIKEIGETIDRISPTVSFGISPSGVWANNTTNYLGSDTKSGYESYSRLYADTRKWVKEEWIDYIAPQLYWEIGFDLVDYKKILPWWTDVVSGTDVDLYIGQAPYRSVYAGKNSVWYGESEMVRQLVLNDTYSEVDGSIFFSYKSLDRLPNLATVIKGIFNYRDNNFSDYSLNVAVPSSNISTSFDKFYFTGSCNPGSDLYLNGNKIETLSQRFFGSLVPLDYGPNTITFTQGDKSVTKVIYRNYPEDKPSYISSIPASSTYPQKDLYLRDGEYFKFYCNAPTGAYVSVTFGGNTYPMIEGGSTSGNTSEYRYKHKISDYGGTLKKYDLGSPTYAVSYKGKYNYVSAPGNIGVIVKGTPMYAKANKEVIHTTAKPYASMGRADELYKDMTDYITGMHGDYYRLSSGLWVKKEDVDVITSSYAYNPKIYSAVYNSGDTWDKIEFNLSLKGAATAKLEKDKLTLDIYNVLSGTYSPEPLLPESSPFKSIYTELVDEKLQYVLLRKDGKPIDGYFIKQTDHGFNLEIKKRPTLKQTSKPLKGITIVLDPGHGGSSYGAIGPLGKSYAEKKINLEISKKLENDLTYLGANIIMTRTTDTYTSLDKRLSISREAKPDMFISVHANSMPSNVDISKTFGFSVFYQREMAKTPSKVIYDTTISSLNRNKHGIRSENFYVTRGSWTPSLLIETGFVTNPTEFSWLIDPDGQEEISSTITKGILKYFSK